ncbi:MAG: hypothetical protein O8C61_07645 [Candidatus Methanoperedens sp.]|nr:hypothetical protein [Candidatus Methanoperedens sp.]
MLASMHQAASKDKGRLIPAASPMGRRGRHRDLGIRLHESDRFK